MPILITIKGSGLINLHVHELAYVVALWGYSEIETCGIVQAFQTISPQIPIMTLQRIHLGFAGPYHMLFVIDTLSGPSVFEIS